MGIDWGEKRIGLAVADSETKIATPLSVVSNLKDLKGVVKEEGSGVLIVGSPVKMSGERRDLNPAFLNFLELLKEEFPDKEIIQFDERLTSKQADALPGKKKEKAGRDETSAMIILQNYLDSNEGDF